MRAPHARRFLRALGQGKGSAPLLPSFHHPLSFEIPDPHRSSGVDPGKPGFGLLDNKTTSLPLSASQ